MKVILSKKTSPMIIRLISDDYTTIYYENYFWVKENKSNGHSIHYFFVPLYSQTKSHGNMTQQTTAGQCEEFF